MSLKQTVALQAAQNRPVQPGMSRNQSPCLRRANLSVAPLCDTFGQRWPSGITVADGLVLVINGSAAIAGVDGPVVETVASSLDMARTRSSKVDKSPPSVSRFSPMRSRPTADKCKPLHLGPGILAVSLV